MMPFFRFDEVEMLCFALVLIRVIAFIVSWPVFSVYSVPNSAKILFSLVLSFLIFPLVSRSGLSAAEVSSNIIYLVAKEAFAGLILGFTTRMYFFCVSIGGNMIATSMGLASAQMFNPSLNMHSTTVEEFYMVLGTLLFLSLNGHHVFLTGLVHSFTAIPLSLHGLEVRVFAEWGKVVQDVMVSGIKIAAPVMMAIFFVNVAMGILGRTVPQINVFVTSLPVNIMIALGVMILMIPILLIEMDSMMQAMAEQLFKMMKAL